MHSLVPDIQSPGRPGYEATQCDRHVPDIQSPGRPGYEATQCDRHILLHLYASLVPKFFRKKNTQKKQSYSLAVSVALVFYVFPSLPRAFAAPLPSVPPASQPAPPHDTAPYSHNNRYAIGYNAIGHNAIGYNAIG